tara:strand:- start:5584 stop:5820 length:237 start_codon:yes stop_codon:yes gene_type:complete
MRKPIFGSPFFKTHHIRRTVAKERAGTIKAVSLNEARLTPAQRTMLKNAGWKRMDLGQSPASAINKAIWVSPKRPKKK